MEETKEVSLGGFVASKSKEEEFLDPTAVSRVHPTTHGKVLAKKEESSLNLPSTTEEFEKTNLPHTIGQDLPMPVLTSIVGVAWEFRSFLGIWRIGEASLSLVDSPPNIRSIVSGNVLFLSKQWTTY
ncbi:hypothetical protein M9H77_30656 [Catharanthus roseus]|uniref:Uncharacterized protein n=1 Tax=Catharanthus roseus TaxID=4058 RepID=A0ACB9ZY71_CATRO|nr:hypothetical protein M9H77_30656 [Catharanthus roseus]